MSKNRSIIFSILLLVALASVCYLSITQVKTYIEVNEEQSDLSENILSTPKTSGLLLERWNYTSNQQMYSVAVSADGKYMAVGTQYTREPGKVFFFNTSNHDGTPEWIYNAGMVNIERIAISANGSYIVAGCNDGSGHNGIVFLLNSSKPVSGAKQEVWNATAPDFLETVGYSVKAVDISADGKYIAIGSEDGDEYGYVTLYNYTYNSTGGRDKTYEDLWHYETYWTVTSVAISGDGNYVVAGTWWDEDEAEIYFFNNTEDYLADYTIGDEIDPIWIYDADPFDIEHIAISANGQYIAASGYYEDGYEEGRAFLLNSSTPISGSKQEVWNVSMPDLNMFFYSVDISADGTYVVLGGELEDINYPGFVIVYNNMYNSTGGRDKSDEYLWYYQTNGTVRSVSISANGMYIAAGTTYDQEIGDNGSPDENTVFLFKNQGYTPQSPYPFNPMRWFNTSNTVYSVSISSLGNYIATAGEYSSSRTYLFFNDITIPLVLLPSGGDDDDDNEKEPAAIPFGNYYLLFALFAVVSLILIYKRKAFWAKNKF